MAYPQYERIKVPLPVGVHEACRPYMTEDAFRQLIQQKLQELSK